jgi:heat shock protein HslJ
LAASRWLASHLLAAKQADADDGRAQTPAPAQVPRPPSGTMSPGSTIPAGGSSMQAGSVLGTWLWQRTEMSDGTVITAADPTQYVLGFGADGRMSLQADCNRGGGSYTVSGAQLTLQPGPMTLAARPPGSQDTVFLRDLRNVATYVRDGENLVLNMRIDSGNMVFSPQPAASLTGTPWRVQSVNNGRGGVASVVQGTQLSATFGEDGNVSGETGCNMFRGPYTLTDDTISFGALISTRRACLSEAATAQEQAFLAALAASSRVELTPNRLTLRDSSGATQVILAR